MRRIRNLVRQYFGFSRGETNGFFLLLLLLAGIVAAPFLARRSPAPYDPTADRLLLDSLVAQMEGERPYTPGTRHQPQPQRYQFNPNHLDLAQWQELGVPRYVAQRIINDLKKIYGRTDSLYQQLYPYMELPADRPPREPAAPRDRTFPPREPAYARREPAPPRPARRFEITPFDLNLADTVQLKQIRGIGSRLSARIVTFRDRLGGFHALEQLQEVYGLPPEMVDSLRKYGFVQPGFRPERIALNSATVDELRAHPYIAPPIARAIVSYRGQHGPYQQVADLQKIKIIDQALYQKIHPYLTVE
jgi:competence protein ComEA